MSDTNDQLQEAAVRIGNLEDENAELCRKLNDIRTWYYQAEESLCSCSIADGIVCDWHERNPGAPDAEIFSLANQSEKAEAQRDALAAALIIPKAIARTFAAMKPPESFTVDNEMYWTAKGMLENWLPEAEAALASINVPYFSPIVTEEERIEWVEKARSMGLEAPR